MPRTTDRAALIADLGLMLEAEAVLQAVLGPLQREIRQEDDETTVVISTEIQYYMTALLYQGLISSRYIVDRGRIYKDYTHMADMARNLHDRGFRNYFRMTKASFFALADAIKDDDAFTVGSNRQLPVDYQLGVFMYRCGNAGMSTMAIGNHFGIGEGTVYNCLARVVLALLRVWKDHVYWPRGHEYATNRSSISEGSNGLFKGCVGFLDGTYRRCASVQAHRERRSVLGT